MSAFDYDLITIGAGSGGVAGSRRAASYGARVAICEDSRVGGTCVIRGCVPKKLLMYGSQYAEAFEDAAGYGWSVEGARLDWGALVAAKDKEIDRLEGVYRRMLDQAGVTLLEGRAVLVDPHTVEVAGRRYTAERIMIATGGHPMLPDIPGIELAITSNEALSLDKRPDDVLIVGGGYIALEFAGIFRGAGANVTLAIRRDQVLGGFDEDIRSTMADALQRRGIVIRPHTRVIGLARREGRIAVQIDDGEILVVDQVLMATGRAPNTRGLGLEACGVVLGERGAVKVDAQSRTSVPNIYAVGDVTDRLNLTPWAIAEGRALAETLYNDNPMQADPENVPAAVFSQPPVATVGLSEQDARARYGKVRVYRSKFRPMKNTLSGRDEQTMMKLVVDDATDRVVGCHMVGPDGPEIIQGLAIALKCGATKRQFDQTIGLHPTAAEEFVTMREPVGA
ncbi:MAG: glutathione-disulfide reductase [Pigmentiphaga sp.]|uniref:glutathione-disulfide reductase n=1 Tax=Pigmentiphaga sp. TaxID=1977564 RepID=UPI0029BE7DF7|nr:glutathione-disulfide reductase [Pigmentiphaga sp.]MDX3905197.1 glutathione-disulfide reductase [Pigmentiphaga sp.]